jgi:clan AA aspartic protease
VISGTATAAREAEIQVQVENVAGVGMTVRAVVDTGFTGSIALPHAVINALSLPLLQQRDAQLADGPIEVFDLHEVTIVWDGQPLKLLAFAAEPDALIGMGLLSGFRLCLDAVDGGPVTLEQIP